MNSPNLPFLHKRAETEALFDHLERDLLSLTTAQLDEHELMPAQVVDEFATEFLRDLARPPR
ncbi:MAG: hypothetical protein ACXWC4_16940 [Telluria sp.]